MKLRIKVLIIDELVKDQVYLTAVKFLGTLDTNMAATISGPARLEYLDDESGQWIPVEVDATNLEFVKAEHVREVSGEVPIQVPLKN